MRKAFEIFDDMRAHGIVPDTITYSTMIAVCANCGSAGKAIQLFEDMKVAGLVPNVIT